MLHAFYNATEEDERLLQIVCVVTIYMDAMWNECDLVSTFKLRT